MPSIEITDEQHDRFTALCTELADAHVDSYTSVTTQDTVAYLLDLADAVEDPDRQATAGSVAAKGDGTAPADPFPRERLETRLSERNRRHSEADPDDPMDLSTIAATYDISGRSSMTKSELITAILDAVERRYTDPLAPVDVVLPDPDDSTDATDTDTAAVDSASDGDSAQNGDSPPDSDSDGGDDDQLDAMLSLLDTHSDKWHSADGDARYEVELPDGSVESARTKDDVRATLFKHY
jgi:Rho termination factor, N-terminal domain.